MSATLAIGTVSQLEIELARVHDLIPTLADDELIALRRSAEDAGNATWLVECHCLWEARRRQVNRNDTEDLHTLARAFDLSQQHVSELVRIWQHFGSSTDRSVELPLPKTFYTYALKADDPPAAIAKAEDRKAADPGYSVRDFGRDIRVDRKIDERTEPMGLSESQVVERIRVPAATAMRRLLAASEAVRPIKDYLPSRVALVVGEDDGWPAVVRLAEWVLRVEAARRGRGQDAAD